MWVFSSFIFPVTDLLYCHNIYLIQQIKTKTIMKLSFHSVVHEGLFIGLTKAQLGFSMPLFLPSFFVVVASPTITVGLS